MTFVFEGYDPKGSNTKQESSNKFVFEGYEKPEEKTNDISRLAMQAGIGLGKGAIYASPAAVPAIAGDIALPGAIQGVIGDLLESDLEHQALYPGEFPKLNRQQIEQGAKQTERNILGEEGLVGGLVSAPFRAAGADTKPATSEEKATRGVGEFLSLLRGGGSPQDLKKAAAGAFIGEAGKETLVELGVPDWLAEIISLGSAAHISNMTPKVTTSKTGKQKLNESISERSYFKPGTPPPEPPLKISEKFESGLIKPRAVEAALPEAALISKGNKRRTIEKLEQEAQGLFKQSVQKHLPLTKKIEEGFDFSKYHGEEFGKLKEAAEKFNPDINTSPLNKFFSETIAKYRGIPNPHADAKAIKAELQHYSRKSPGDLATLLKIRRSNSKKLKEIYDKRLLEGKRDEYVDFLNNMNRKIDEAIGNTLPEDSSWFKNFKRLNKEFGDYMSAKKTLDLLEPIFREKVNSAAVTKIATNPNTQKKLEISLGKEGAAEIIQISKDLKKATEAIKKMTTESYKHFNSIFSLSFFLKPVKWARKGYGHILSSPSRRHAFDDALKAISNNDVKAYEKATSELI